MSGLLSGSVTGFLAKDPDVRAKVTRLSIPVQIGKDGVTTWVGIAVFGKSAEFAANLKKGDIVACSGRMELREHDGKKYLEMAASDMQLLPKGNASSGSGASRDDDRGPSPDDSRRGGGAPSDEDIPF